MVRRLGLTVVGLAAVAAAIVAYVRFRPAPAASGTDSARLRALEARLALLEQQRRTGPMTVPVAPSEPHVMVPVAPSSVPDEAPTKATRPGAARAAASVDEVALQREYFGDLDVRLGTETRDPVWAAATEERLRNSVREMRPRLTLDNAQCGQSMCRVEAAVTDPHEDAAAMEKFLSSSLALFPEAVLRDGEGPGRHIVYFARKGSEFPPMSKPEGAGP
jgi:hypothetical protein